MNRLLLHTSLYLILAAGLCAGMATLAYSDDRGRDEVPDMPTAQDLDVSAIGKLKVRLPAETLQPTRFRHDGRRGWVVRMPNPRAPRTTTGNERLATVPSPAVWRDRVYAGVGFDGWALHAFDATSGKHAYTTPLKDNGPTSPTITPRKLVCNTESCTTYAITPRHGKVDWSRWVGPSVMGAPAADAGIVYTGHRTKTNEYMLSAMRLKDGSVLWERALTRDIYGKPIVYGSRIYVGCRDGVVACFEKNGRPLWFSRPGTTCAPWVGPEGVYITEGSSHRKGPPAVRRLDADTGKTIWKTDTGLRRNGRRVDYERYERTAPFVRLMSGYGTDGPRPVVVDGHCVMAGGRDLTAYDLETGKVRWIRRLPSHRRFHAPPAVLGTKLVYVTLHGLVLEVEGRTGAIVKGLDLQRLVSSQPVVAKGRLHLTAGTLLYGIPWSKASGPSWPQWGGMGEEPKAARVTTKR